MVVWIGLDEPTPFFQVGLEDDCEDINECEERPGLCGAAGRCLNTQGGHQCECERGYQLTADGTGCVDTRRGICYNKVTAGRYSIVASSVQGTILHSTVGRQHLLSISQDQFAELGTQQHCRGNVTMF